MSDHQGKMPTGQRGDDARSAPLEGEVIGPGESGPRPSQPGGVFFEFRTGDGATFQVKPLSRWKVALILMVAAALAIAILVTFASLFVIAAVIGTCVVIVAASMAWVKSKLGIGR